MFMYVQAVKKHLGVGLVRLDGTSNEQARGQSNTPPPICPEMFQHGKINQSKEKLCTQNGTCRKLKNSHVYISLKRKLEAENSTCEFKQIASMRISTTDMIECRQHANDPKPNVGGVIL